MIKDRTLVERCTTYAKAVSDPNRMKMLKIIGSAPGNTLSVNDIADQIGLSQPATSRNLQILWRAGFLKRTKAANRVYYVLDKDAVNDFTVAAENAFEKVWTPCIYGYDCENCPYSYTCK